MSPSTFVFVQSKLTFTIPSHPLIYYHLCQLTTFNMMRFTKELIKFSLSEAAGATDWIIVESLKKGKNEKMMTNKKKK